MTFANIYIYPMNPIQQETDKPRAEGSIMDHISVLIFYFVVDSIYTYILEIEIIMPSNMLELQA